MVHKAPSAVPGAAQAGLSPLVRLRRQGQSVWLDYLSRDLIRSGELGRLVDLGVSGVTSNPTIFEQAISKGEAYDEQLATLLKDPEIAEEPKEVFLRLAERDIEDACDLLRPVYDESEGADGFVSLEVDPSLAADIEATIAEATRLHEMVSRPNLLVKIPATLAGVAAFEEMIAKGHSINVTLIFSLERYKAVVEAYQSGLERLLESGGDPSRVHSVASFFVSRVDTEADKRLEAIGSEEALSLRGKLGVANARLAYQHYLEAFSSRSERWSRLEAENAWTQRPLWASTSTKNPDYPDTVYVEELVGSETVNTMPRETLEAFQDHGFVRGDTVLDDLDGARKLLEDLERVGVDYDDVTKTLEEEGVEKFAKSFAELLEGVGRKERELEAVRA